jgi:hypothetical protein
MWRGDSVARYLDSFAATSYTAGMAMTLSTELEERLNRFVALGRFETLEQALEGAVAYRELEMQQADEVFSGWSKGELGAMIDEGLASAENEPLMSGEEVRAYPARARSERVAE